ncbi:DUF922 domain-containing Zn-dependent protease [Rhizobium halophytocola]|uniref:Secreted Zn-dependent protease n=1 Tax=Rhizobium halophytocola TaxID=735519 RepID=A0ABS4DZ70_9HYPH|nr:DUF922 domain-containing protein [Rhizobium halophytocola]MBP1850991.1 putative secreted Zn-dependent protease [Rhizobium halophytocola]
MKLPYGLAPAALASLFLLTCTHQAPAQAIVRKTVSYFSIGGHTAEDLDRELQTAGPFTNSTNSRHPGATKIKFDGELNYVQKNGRCSIGTIKVIVKAHMILPRWKYRRHATKDLAMIWDALSSDIERHEARHAEIAKQHAHWLDNALRALPPMANCSVLQDKVAQISDEAIAAHDKDQMRFDRVEAINFERRMIRILQTRLQRSNTGK